jgi:hypothetical protein
LQLPDKTTGAMEPTTPEDALEKLARWRDSRTWVSCIVAAYETSFGYRVIGGVFDFDDDFLIGTSGEGCFATLPTILFHQSQVIEIDSSGGLHVRFPHAEAWISEVAKITGHA